MKRRVLISVLIPCLLAVAAGSPFAQDGQAVIERAVNHLRGETSTAVVTMTIHRPDWERVMTITAWTRGREESIFWIVDPPKDRGNGTLKKDDEMWIFNPKINRVIKLPPSMMSQAWQGSDFSNNDVAKSDDIIDQYTHEIIGTETHEGKTVTVIRSLPKPGAPVIWGMQELKIREDNILIKQVFFDEAREPVKVLTLENIEMRDDRLYPVTWRMAKADADDEYTVINYRSLEFGVPIDDRMFTLASLKNPRLRGVTP